MPSFYCDKFLFGSKVCTDSLNPRNSNVKSGLGSDNKRYQSWDQRAEAETDWDYQPFANVVNGNKQKEKGGKIEAEVDKMIAKMKGVNKRNLKENHFKSVSTSSGK